MGANAQIAVPAFTAGQILTAAQQTQINTGIPVFATTTTRDAAFGGAGEKTLAQGQTCYIEATSSYQTYTGSAWANFGAAKIGQVVSTFKSDTFITTSTTFVDVTGLTVSITPTAATSTVLVMATFTIAGAGGTQRGARIARGGTGIALGAAAGGRTQAWWGTNGGQVVSVVDGVGITFLDSPATTSATTYSVQVQTNDGYDVAVNRFSSQGAYNMASSITVMEILA